MKTILTTSLIEAAEYIKRGGIVAFPTETVYGLGANAFDERAIAKIFAAKMRPADNPLIAHVSRIEDIEVLVEEITGTARKFIEAFFPAPLTIVLPKSERIPLIATANLETVGVRMPRDETAREFLKACGAPVVAPSANLSGRPSPTTWRAVYEDLNGRIDCILQSERSAEIGLESTVVDCTGKFPLVLRSGAITLEQLQDIVSETRVYTIEKDEPARSPGLKHRHYSPQAQVVLIGSKSKVRSSKSKAFIGFNLPDENFDLIKICRSAKDYAHSVFDFFRQCDRKNVETIYCETIEEKGIGLALMDRLKRAAEGR